MRRRLATGLFVLCPALSWAYPATLDVSDLSSQRVAVISQSKEPVQCALRAFEDTVFMQLSPGSRSQTLNIRGGVKRHNLSLRCERIEQVTKPRAWRQIRHAILPNNYLIFY